MSLHEKKDRDPLEARRVFARELHIRELARNLYAQSFGAAIRLSPDDAFAYAEAFERKADERLDKLGKSGQ